MNRSVFSPRWILLLALVSLVFGAVGCATDDSSNASGRPWNSPAGWESTGGLPGNMMEGR